MLRNNSTETVHVLGFGIMQTSDNVDVEGFRTYSLDEFGKVVSSYDPRDPVAGIDLSHPLPLEYSLSAHQESHRFTMVKLRLTAFPPPGFARGCLVKYRVGSGDTHVQLFDCTYYFGEHAHEYFDGRASLTVTNSYPRDVTLLGCPICKSHGVKIEGTPEGGSLLGWNLGRGDPRGVTVVVERRRVLCRPPGGAARRRYEALHGPDLYYEIRKSGRCVLQD
jgi:hypothetical protein